MEYVSPSKLYRSLLYYCGTCHVEPKFREQRRSPSDQWKMPKPVLHNQRCDLCSKKSTFLLAQVFDGLISEADSYELVRAARFFATIKPVLRVSAPQVDAPENAALDDAW